MRLISTLYINIRSALVAVIVLTAFYTYAGANNLDSCKYELKGRVIDAASKQPIPYANIKVENAVAGVTTGDDGHFAIKNLCHNQCNLICSCVGYQPTVYHIDNYQKDITIKLVESSFELEEVVVQDKSSGLGDGVESMALNQVTKKDISSKISQSLGEVISGIQGVTYISNGNNVQLPVIHGLYGNRVLIVNNGVKHGFQNWGLDHSPEISLSSIDRITVLKGAASVKYGPEALGGVVIVEGNPLSLFQKFNGSVSTGYETNGRGYHVNAELNQGFDRFSYYLGGSYIEIGDRRAPEYNLTNTGKEEIAANAGFHYHISNWHFKFRYNFTDQDLGLLRSSVFGNGDDLQRAISSPRPLIVNDFSYTINEPSQATKHHLAVSTVDWHSPIGNFSLRLSKQVNSRKEYDVRRNADLPIINLNLETEDARIEWKHLSLNQLEGSVGLQYFIQDNDNIAGTGVTAFIPNYNTRRWSFFLIESLIKEKTTYELGLRMDREYNSVRGRVVDQSVFRNEYSFSNVTASLGVLTDITEKIHFRSNLSSSWRAPNIAELYSFGQHGFKSIYGLWRYYETLEGTFKTDRVLNEEEKSIRPEKGYKWISEIEVSSPKTSLVATIYANYIENFIFERPLAVVGTVRGPMPVFIYDQTNAVFFGADLTYSHDLHKNWEYEWGLSYLWSRNIDDDAFLINQPPINISYALNWSPKPLFDRVDLTFDLKTTYTFEQYQSPRTIAPEEIANGSVEITSDDEIFDFKDAPQGYFLADLGCSWSWEKLSGRVGVQNLLNTSYRNYLNQMRYFADEPGRNFLFSIQYKF